MQSPEIAMLHKPLEHVVLTGRQQKVDWFCVNAVLPGRITQKPIAANRLKTKHLLEELELARSLVSHLKALFKPHEFRDEYRENGGAPYRAEAKSARRLCKSSSRARLL